MAQDRRRAFPQHVTRRCAGDGARGAVEEPGAQHRLQTLDLLGQRGLSDMQPSGRATEMQFLGDRQEVPQMPQLDPINHKLKISIRPIKYWT
ncbi:hypothetical protein GCM10027089_00030 [Nocardia thraciensis]